MEKVIRFRISTEEKERIEVESSRLGLSISAFIRLLLRNWTDGIRFEKDKGINKHDPVKAQNETL